MSTDIPGKPQGAGLHGHPACDLEARHTLILGHPPRLAPLEPGEISEEAMAVMMETLEAISRPRPDKISAYSATMLRHPGLYRRHTELALELFRGALTARHRELAILRLGWLCQAPFEWGEHVHNGKHLAGLTSEEIEQLKQGSTARIWNEDDHAILRAVEELVGDAMITDETWAVLTRYLDERQLIELLVLVGHYQGVAYLQNTLRCPLLPGNAGLFAG